MNLILGLGDVLSLVFDADDVTGGVECDLLPRFGQRRLSVTAYDQIGVDRRAAGGGVQQVGIGNGYDVAVSRGRATTYVLSKTTTDKGTVDIAIG